MGEVDNNLMKSVLRNSRPKKRMNWAIIGIIITILIAGFSYLTTERSPKAVIEITCIDRTELTKMPKIQEVSAHFYYRDTVPVRNLWKVRYVIKNIGDDIIGQGDKRQILGVGIPLKFNNKGKILDLSITDNSNEAMLKNDSIFFKQWKNNEYIELTGYIESDSIPSISIDDRDIVSSKIIKHEYIDKVENNNDALMIQFLPNWFSNALRIMYCVVFAIMLLGIVITIINSINNKKDILANIIGGIIGVIIFVAPLLWMF